MSTEKGASVDNNHNLNKIHLQFSGLKTTDITARAGQDYVRSDVQVEFLPQETTAAARITIIDDYVKESVESFRVTLADPSDGVIGPRSEVVVSIVDDDGNNDLYFLFLVDH